MTLKDIPEICHCGKPMHLSDAQKVLIGQFGRKWGKNKKVLFGKKAYEVPGYFIILHGINGADVLDFPEWSESS